MTSPNKTDLAKGWLQAEKRLDDDGDRLAALSDAEFDEAMEALPDPSRVPTVEDLLRPHAKPSSPSAAPSSGPATVTPIGAVQPLGAKRSGARVVWLVAAAIVLLVGAIKRDAIVALFAPVTPKPVPTIPSPGPPSPSPLELAATARHDAQLACHREDWNQCEARLDEAKRLDPDGDLSQNVKDLRADIHLGQHPEDEIEAKPK